MIGKELFKCFKLWTLREFFLYLTEKILSNENSEEKVCLARNNGCIFAINQLRCLAFNFFPRNFSGSRKIGTFSFDLVQFYQLRSLCIDIFEVCIRFFEFISVSKWKMNLEKWSVLKNNLQCLSQFFFLDPLKQIRLIINIF